MTWTYDASTLSSSNKDQVRFAIGDTDTTDQQLSDEEINWLLTYTDDSVANASYLAAERILAKWSKKADKTVGGLSLNYSDKVNNYKELVKLLKKKATVAATPEAFGMSSTDGQGVLLANEPEDDIRPGSAPGELLSGWW